MNTSTPIPPRRRLQELLSIPDNERTEAQWDEIVELEISLAPGNRLGPGDLPGQPLPDNRSPRPRKHKPQGRGPAPSPAKQQGDAPPKARRHRPMKKKAP